MSETRVELSDSFDFENYMSNYQGLGKISRCLFIAKKCNQVAIEAYRYAIKEIQENTFNIEKYKTAVKELNAHLIKKEQAPEPLDQNWIDNVRAIAKATADSLEADLKIAKSKLFKEEMRACYIRLGEHYYKCGDGPSAIRNFVRTRDYCTTNQHTIEMCFNTIKVYLDECNFTHVVQTYIARAESIPNTAHNAISTAKLKCYQALTLLGKTDAPKKYRSVAEAMIDIPFEAGSFCSDTLSPNDIAIYGGLSALASFDRRELQTRLLNNANFKNFLGLEPSLYELIESFYRSKYTRCFEILNEYKQLLRLDMFMESSLDRLMQLVHEKAIVQYCTPYSNIDMRKMARAFNIDVDTLEDYLVDLIGKNEMMTARIDSHNKIVRTKKQDKRTQAFEQSFVAEASVIVGHRFANTAEDYEERELWEKAAEAHSKAAGLRKFNDLNRKLERMKSVASQKDRQLSTHNNLKLMGSNGGLRNALPEKKNSKYSGHLVSRLSNKGEYLSSEDGLRRAGGIGESYALLSNDDDNDDTFNKFLETVDTLLQGLINPAVAFTSAPLNKNDIPVLNDTQTSDDEIDAQITNNNMMESFYISAEEGNTLKNSILQFRNNVHQQAKRIMQSHYEYSMRLSAVALSNGGANSINVNSIRYPSLLGAGTSGGDLVNRLKELEEENKQLKAQNEKQKKLANKYKEKWDMLKENAKKRRASTPMQKTTNEEK
ncbi:hypothetical protein G6F36_003583 [Rhizopus arrhizus]|nr:hypothetical protein G6F36_003583 [Rhizopus arrhizus]